jgi:dipeptidyl aminopeptidase/acylaminoacyl peptidase
LTLTSSFPAQTLAGEGYLVLLLNAPGTSQGFKGDSEIARQLEGWNKLELFEQAVDLLVERGIGDPNKVGIYGWSHGAFIVNFIISHSQKFHVACLGEGGDYNPGGFWKGGSRFWPKIYESTFGGPPWGETLKNYLDFSPFFQVDKIRAPLLLEFASESGNSGFEMYVPLRYLNVPAELVIYDGEEHNFIRPKARMASMARKLEWFNFWFFDKQNFDPKKQKQYERWGKMRKEAIEKGLLNTSLTKSMTTN